MKKRLQFSLRFMFYASLPIACLLCWLSFEIQRYLEDSWRYREDHPVMVGAAKNGGTAHFVARDPKWLWARFGDNVPRKGTALWLSNSVISDSQIAELETLSHIGGLHLDGTPVTNKGLVCLRNMVGLVDLGLSRTEVTELPPLSHMKQLVKLDVSFSKVSNIDLNGLESLQNLYLRGTLITDDTVAAFPPLPELLTLDISGVAGRTPLVTDKGIQTITKDNFPKLKTLYIYYCDISDGELSRLKTEFPMLTVTR